MENLFHILKLSLVTFIAFSGVGHVGANPNKNAQEKINAVMSEAMKSSDLPTIVAVGVTDRSLLFGGASRRGGIGGEG